MKLLLYNSFSLSIICTIVAEFVDIKALVTICHICYSLKLTINIHKLLIRTNHFK